jgi:hypothetical protein
VAKKTVQDLILDKLDKMDGKIDKLHDKVDLNIVETAKDITELKVKSSIWGGVSGAVSGIAVGLVAMFTNR